MSLVSATGAVPLTVTVNNNDSGEITFTKDVVGGEALASDWTFAVEGPETVGNIASGDTLALSTGSYTVTEDGPITYTLTGASGVCSLVGDTVILSVTEGGGTCTITNTWRSGGNGLWRSSTVG